MNYIKNKRNAFLRRINQRGLQYMIAASFTLVALVGMVFIGAFLYQSYGRAAEELILNDNSQLISQVEINLNNYLRSMMRISDAMYYNVIKNVDMRKDDISQELNLLYEVNKDSLVSIACFSQEGELMGAAPAGSIKKNMDVREQNWFKNAENKMENLHFSELHVQNIFENTSGRYYWVVSLSRGVELTMDGIMSGGILLVDMNFSGIRQIFTEINSQGFSYVYLVNSEGEIIYHPRQNLIFSNMLKENNKAASQYDDGVHEENFQGEERMVIVKTVGYTGWKIVSVTPKTELLSDFDSTKIMAVIIIILAVMLMVFANQFVAVRIAKPLKKLENSLKGIGVSREPQIYIGGSTEIQHLGQTIRSMVEQLRELTDNIVREQEAKRKSELDALQSQINPHFLYNTLDSIMWMIESERYDDAVSMVHALGKLLRISLSKGKNIISVGDELQHARSYLDIQKYRYKNKFTSYFDIEEGIEEYKTIKLILQPLIENAIYYGMEYMDGEGEIHIRAYTEGEGLYMEVQDNGPGMPPEQVEKLLVENSETRSKGSGIGLRNVYQRIQLYFGKDYGLEITSEPDEGTTIKIHLPKTEETSPEEGRNRP